MDQRTRKHYDGIRPYIPEMTLERLYVSRKEGGRRLASNQDSVEDYIKKEEDWFQRPETTLWTFQATNKWNFTRKKLNMVKKKKKGNLKSKTECLLIAAQNSIIRTNYAKARIVLVWFGVLGFMAYQPV